MCKYLTSFNPFIFNILEGKGILRQYYKDIKSK